ncbi:MAG: hypothetical protein ACLPZR_12595 [Solirubrobacteraceae bacterium]
MRRILVIVTALVVLGAAATAYAAINTYQSTVIPTSTTAGSVSNPVPIGYTQNISAAGTNGNRTAVLTNITTKIYGVKADGKDFPTCSLTTIANAHNDTVCPKGAEVATGFITAAVGAANNFAVAGASCDPLLDVWNAGQGKLVYFFVDTPTHQCLGGALKTGSTGPYPATETTQGKYLVVAVPVPSYVSFPAPGEAGSLETEHLVWAKHTTKVKGKTVASIASVACLKGKRPYTTTFEANLPNSTTGAPGPTVTDTIKGSAPC